MVRIVARLCVVLLGLLVACSCDGNGMRVLTAHDGGESSGDDGSRAAAHMDMAMLLDMVGDEDVTSLSQLGLAEGETICVNATLASAAADVTMEVYDANGSKVRTGLYGAMAAGSSTEVWDGLDDCGVVEPSGTYSIKLWATDINGNAISVTLSPCQENSQPD